MSQGNSQAAFDYFNNANGSNTNNIISPAQQQTENSTENDTAARAKRTACTLCRKRKLRCDGTRPSCATCSRLGHDCRYDEVRKKSGPKRGYVKVLEARLAQVESMLKTQDSTDTNDMDISEPPVAEFAFPPSASMKQTEEMIRFPNMDATQSCDALAVGQEEVPILQGPYVQDNFGVQGFAQQEFSPEAFSWELIALGLEEPLPAQEITDEL